MSRHVSGSVLRMAGAVSAAAWLLAGTLSAAETATPQQTRRAAERGVAFLERDGVAWMNERKCISCHHVGMAVYGLTEAKRQGFKVNQDAVNELAHWALN